MDDELPPITGPTGSDTAAELTQARADLAWIRKKLGLPTDAQMFQGDQTIAGTLHVICSHAHGWTKYIQAYKCNDKDGEIARQAVRIGELATEVAKLRNAITEHHKQKADDRCWMDDVVLYNAAGLPAPDFRVGDKAAMKANCDRFIDRRCAGGHWPSYADLEAELAKLNEAIKTSGYGVMRESNGRWSIHDVSERQKIEDKKTAAVIMENIDQAMRITELEASLTQAVEHASVGWAKFAKAKEAAEPTAREATEAGHKVRQCPKWISDHTPTGPTNTRCRLIEGHFGDCARPKPEARP